MYLPRPHTPIPLRQDEALRSADPRARVLAHALDALAAVAPTAVSAIGPLGRRLEAFAEDPIVVRLDPPTLPIDVFGIHRGHLTGDPSADPFDPRRWTGRKAGVVAASEIADRGESTACGLLDAHGISRRATVYLRDRGRPVGLAVLMRRVDDPDLSAAELDGLRQLQPLVEHALALAGERPAPLAGTETLRALGLSGREAEVAQLAAAGATNREVAAELCLSVNTVKTHLGRVFSKLRVRSRTELALLLAERAESYY